MGNSGLYRSTNGGQNWSQVLSGRVDDVVFTPSGDTAFAVGSGIGIRRSTNGGQTFLTYGSDLPSSTRTHFDISLTNPNIMYAAVYLSGQINIYKSTNYGINWRSITPNSGFQNLAGQGWYDLYCFVNPKNPNKVYVGTIDNGTTWTEISNGLPNTVIMHLDFADSTKMLRAATHGRGVYEAYIDFTIPVELTSFYAYVNNQSVQINWSTATETNNSYFEVYRKFKNQDWELIAENDGAGTTVIPQSYSFTDDYSFITYSGKILYRLKQIDFDGSFNYSEIISVEVNFVPNKFSLSQNYPNPFNPSSTIRYSIPNSVSNLVKVILKVYDVLRNEITTLVNEDKLPGNYQVEFNGANFTSGLYLYSLEVYDNSGFKIFQQSKKMTFLK